MKVIENEERKQTHICQQIFIVINNITTYPQIYITGVRVLSHEQGIGEYTSIQSMASSVEPMIKHHGPVLLKWSDAVPEPFLPMAAQLSNESCAAIG